MDQGGKPNITQRKTLVLIEQQNLQVRIRKTEILAELLIGTRVVSLYIFSINLLVVYRKSVNLIAYITRRLSADSLQLWIANENRLFRTRDACFTPQCTSRAVFETFELPM